jgi:hypothetical protein
VENKEFLVDLNALDGFLEEGGGGVRTTHIPPDSKCNSPKYKSRVLSLHQPAHAGNNPQLSDILDTW